MKIERLYTLGQFVDLLENGNYSMNIDRSKYNLKAINWYNNFLKQPLNKNMFVNVMPKPTYSEDKISDGQATKSWKIEEKKVIFEDIEIRVGEALIGDVIINLEFVDLIYPTLSDLAEATNGELKLKNVEL